MPDYTLNTLKEAVKYQLAAWRAIRQVEIELGADFDDLQTSIECLCININDPCEITTEFVTPLYEELCRRAAEQQEEDAYAEE